MSRPPEYMNDDDFPRNVDPVSPEGDPSGRPPQGSDLIGSPLSGSRSRDVPRSTSEDAAFRAAMERAGYGKLTPRDALSRGGIVRPDSAPPPRLIIPGQPEPMDEPPRGRRVDDDDDRRRGRYADDEDEDEDDRPPRGARADDRGRRGGRVDDDRRGRGGDDDRDDGDDGGRGRNESAVERYLRAETRANLTSQFGELEQYRDREKRAWEILDDFFRVTESRVEDEFDQSRISQMINGLDRGLIWDTNLRERMLSMARGRYKLHNGMVAAQKRGGEEFANIVSSLQQQEMNAILNIDGFRQASRILEANNGAYWRKPPSRRELELSGDPQGVWARVGKSGDNDTWLAEQKVKFITRGFPTDPASPDYIGNLTEEDQAKFGDISAYSEPELSENFYFNNDLDLNELDDQVRIAKRADVLSDDEAQAVFFTPQRQNGGSIAITRPEQLTRLLEYHKLNDVDKDQFESKLIADGFEDQEIAEFRRVYAQRRETLERVTDKLDAVKFAGLDGAEQQDFLDHLSERERPEFEAKLRLAGEALERVPAQVQRRRELDQIRNKVNLAFNMAEKAAHVFTLSSTYDGPRLNQTEEQRRRDEPGDLVQTVLDPVIDYRYYRDAKGKVVGLKEDEIVTSPSGTIRRIEANGLPPGATEERRIIHLNQVLKLSQIPDAQLTDAERASLKIDNELLRTLRAEQNYRIARAWDQAWIDFYRDHWDEIDFDNSLSGKGSATAKNQLFNAITLMQKSNLHPGRAVELRRLGFGGGEGLMQMTNRSSLVEMMENVQADEGIIRRRWAPRMKAITKFNDTFGQFIDSPNAIADENLKTVVTLVHSIVGGSGEAGYIHESERFMFGKYFTEGVLDFVKNHMRERFGRQGFRNLDTVDIRQRTQAALYQDLIDRPEKDRVERQVAGEYATVKYHAKKLNVLEALWELFNPFK